MWSITTKRGQSVMKILTISIVSEAIEWLYCWEMKKMSEWKIFFKSFSILDPTNLLIISFALPILLIFKPCMKKLHKLMKPSVLGSAVASRTVDVHCSFQHRGRVEISYYSPVLVLTGRRLEANILETVSFRTEEASTNDNGNERRKYAQHGFICRTKKACSKTKL